METDKMQVTKSDTMHLTTVHGNLTLKELEHIAVCEECAEKFAEGIIQQDMIKAPHYMKENILGKVRELERSTEVRYSFLKLNWKNIQLLRYSLKIGLAMCTALALLLIIPPGKETTPQQPLGIVRFLDKINLGISEFSDDMVAYTENLVSNNDLNKEDFKYDKEKK